MGIGFDFNKMGQNVIMKGVADSIKKKIDEVKPEQVLAEIANHSFGTLQQLEKDSDGNGVKDGEDIKRLLEEGFGKVNKALHLLQVAHDAAEAEKAKKK